MTPETTQNDTPKDPAVEFLKSQIEVFHNSIDVAYACINGGSTPEIVTLHSKKFRQFVTKALYSLKGKIPQQNHIKSIIILLELEALEGVEREANIRIAQHEGDIYLDLANSANEQVKISKNGWEIIHASQSPVYFTRPAKMQSLPNPKKDGQLGRLAGFLNLESQDHLYLIFAWLLMALKPNGPYPVLCIQGEQGSGKSSVCRLLKNIFDPSLPVITSMPSGEENLLISALRSQVLAFDNISSISHSASDILCRMATGGGFSKRTLFTDDEETCFNIMRPIILNGITGLNGRQDLCDRTIFINTVPIPQNLRRTEEELQKAFAEAHPDILGGLCTALSTALQNENNPTPTSLPRMADFAKWVVAAEPALPIPPNSFLAAYERNRAEIIDEAIEADPVASAVIAMVAQFPQWTGTATQLLQTLNGYTSDEVRRLNLWPKQANVLSRKLKRAVTFLREKGVLLTFAKSGTRSITITSALPIYPVNPDNYQQ
ncbi:hypothetical protein [Desulfogranum marinum]|uniref:hypothetical protein n=1 Tax=Desulfogranum marinum TaxID=453220 RepID=UPI0019655F1F|nr:hypothetical protein [Desulfogranum marinum]MBM9512007.1 hypothetical protein [Desulfogranum marinum]